MDLQLQLALKFYAFVRQCALLNDYAAFLTTVIFLNMVLQGCKIYCIVNTLFMYGSFYEFLDQQPAD